MVSLTVGCVVMLATARSGRQPRAPPTYPKGHGTVSHLQPNPRTSRAVMHSYNVLDFGASQSIYTIALLRDICSVDC